jgi:hypothetical protein
MNGIVWGRWWCKGLRRGWIEGRGGGLMLDVRCWRLRSVFGLEGGVMRVSVGDERVESKI